MLTILRRVALFSICAFLTGPHRVIAGPLEDLAAALQSSDPIVRASAAKTVAESPPSDLGSVLRPALFTATGDTVLDVRIWALRALGASAYFSQTNASALSQGTSTLITRLGDSDPEARALAATTLGLTYPNTPASAESSLAGKLSDSNSNVRVKALEALGRLSGVSSSTRSSIVGAMSSADSDVQWAAARTLGFVGVGDGPALAALTTALSSSNIEVAISAANALGRFGLAGASARDELEAIVGNGSADPNLRDAATGALSTMVDSDSDGINDGNDRCPYFNPGNGSDQADVDGDRIGNACECGDATGDGYTNVSDIIKANQMVHGTAPITPLCDTNLYGPVQSQRCEATDVTRINYVIFGSCFPVCSRYPQRPAFVVAKGIPVCQ